jgi:hypothetical protein
MSMTIFKGLKDIWSKVGNYLLYKVCNHVCIDTLIVDGLKVYLIFENVFFRCVY